MKKPLARLIIRGVVLVATASVLMASWVSWNQPQPPSDLLKK